MIVGVFDARPPARWRIAPVATQRHQNTASSCAAHSLFVISRFLIAWSIHLDGHRNAIVTSSTYLLFTSIVYLPTACRALARVDAHSPDEARLRPLSIRIQIFHLEHDC